MTDDEGTTDQPHQLSADEVRRLRILLEVKWTEEEAHEARRRADAAMKAARDAGFSFVKIAQEAKCSHVTARKRIADFEAQVNEDA